ncbi:MAG: Fic family protein [Lewinellaceae bacterium]|nr:Fic family protein [Lewinellaceae bacterium]
MEEPLQILLHKADTLREALDQLRPIPEDRMHRIMQKLRMEWNFHSNSIEGNTLTMTETRALIQFGITAKGKPLRDHLEMQGHDRALKRLEQIVHKDLRITESLIKDFHKLILVEPFDSEAEINPGEYKTLPNYLYSPQGERIDFEPPEEVPRLLNELINWTNNHLYPEGLGRHSRKKYNLHPILVACIFHLRFIRIHPFGDGNGRLARILMNLVLMVKGYMPAIIRQESRQVYFNALNQSSEEDISTLASFVLESVIRSMDIALRGARGESVEEPEDWMKKASVLKRKLKESEVQRSSPGLVALRYRDSFLPLFQKAADKLGGVFDDQFESHRIHVSFNREDVSSIWQDANVMVGKIEKEQDPNRLALNYQWMGYKLNGANAFNANFLLEIEFYPYNYDIRIKGMERVFPDKLYSEPLTEEETDYLVNTLGERTLNLIQKRIGHEQA